MAIDKTGDPTKNIEWGRGDSSAQVFQMTERDGVTPENIAGRTYRLTVNSEKNPADLTHQKFSLAGLVTDALKGLVEFQPTSMETDLPPGRYFYDIEETNGAVVRTRLKGVCFIEQDLSK